MADLDDFFAKKDKKRGAKPGKNYSTPDELAKRIEENKKSEPPKSKHQQQQQLLQQQQLQAQQQQQIQAQQQAQLAHQAAQEAGAAPQPQPEPLPLPVREDDEWKDFEVAKKDYTGLKIQNLAINASNAQDNHSDNNKDGDDNYSDSRGRAAWNKGDQPEAPSEEAEEDEDPVRLAPTPSKPAAPTTNSYVPPSLRNRPPGSLNPDNPLRTNRFAKAHAPDIHSEEFFPSLGGESKRGGASNTSGGAWTAAGGGGRSAAPITREAPREVPLGNRFTSLRNDS